MYGLQILCLKSASYSTQHSHNSYNRLSSSVTTTTDTNRDASVGSGNESEALVLDSKSFLRSLLSPRIKKEVKQDLLQPLKQLRFQKDMSAFNAYVDSMIAECDRVHDNKWANRRYWFDLPSYRVRLGKENYLDLVTSVS